MDGKIIVGIDIGSSEICAVAGKSDLSGEIEIIGKVKKSSKGIDRGRVTDLFGASASLEDVIMDLESIIGTKISDVFLAISNGTAELIETEASVMISSIERKVTRRDIERVYESAKQVTSLKGRNIIEFVNVKFILDGDKETENPVGMNCDNLYIKATAVSVDDSIYDGYYKCFLKIGKNIEGIRLSCEAASQLLIDDIDKMRGIALVDSGTSKTDISIYTAGRLQNITQIPLGGANISNDIKYCFEVGDNEAEKIKEQLKFDGNDLMNNITNNYDSKMAEEVVEARINEIISYINQSLKDSEDGYDISNVILYGNGLTHFNNIRDKFSETMGKNIVIVRNEDYKLT
ncbi:cell division protein FtsA [Clostridium polynesiense]|uniref:cell division protein FtsA n=1 Tax=Clostridium polynesiense TaxID=1325933 RepID=UPI00058BA5FB|nr:cell division protein FtsA [Clostridium polynesiense]